MSEVVGKMLNGKFSERDKLVAALNAYDGQMISIKVKRYIANRSQNQNRYCWGVVVPTIKKHLEAYSKDNEGITDDQVYAVLKYHHGLTRKIELPNFTTLTIEGSAAKLGTQAFEEFLENARALAASWGCVVPLPKEEINYTNNN